MALFFVHKTQFGHWCRDVVRIPLNQGGDVRKNIKIVLVGNNYYIIKYYISLIRFEQH